MTRLPSSGMWLFHVLKTPGGQHGLHGTLAKLLKHVESHRKLAPLMARSCKKTVHLLGRGEGGADTAPIIAGT